MPMHTALILIYQYKLLVGSIQLGLILEYDTQKFYKSMLLSSSGDSQISLPISMN